MQVESPTYFLNKDTHPVIRAIEVSLTACKDEVRQKKTSISAGVHFCFHNTSKYIDIPLGIHYDSWKPTLLNRGHAIEEALTTVHHIAMLPQG